MANLTTAKAITFLDIETTHLDPKKSAILSISIVTDWDNGQQDVWTTKIRPADIEIEYASNEALQVCKYDFNEWMDAPSLKEVADTIIKKVKYGPLVAHNIQFDISHLKAVLNRYGYKDLRFGYPLIEAMFHGAIPIATNSSCFPEVLGSAGMLVKSNCENSIISSVKKLIMDDRLRSELKSKSYKRARRFSYDKQIKETTSVYNSLIV